MHASSTHTHTHTHTHTITPHILCLFHSQKQTHRHTSKRAGKNKVTRKNQMLNCPKLRKKVSVVKKGKRNNQRPYKKRQAFFFAVSAHRFCAAIIFKTKLTMALAGWSGSSSAKRWLTLSVVLPCLRATNPNSLETKRQRRRFIGKCSWIYDGIQTNREWYIYKKSGFTWVRTCL